MESFIAKLPAIVEQGSLILAALVVVATIVAKLTPSPKDDKVVSKISSAIFKVLQYLPTFGINPKTKKLEQAYESLKVKDVAPKADK